MNNGWKAKSLVSQTNGPIIPLSVSESAAHVAMIAKAEIAHIKMHITKIFPQAMI